VPFHGEVRQELLHLLEAHVAQMAFVMKEDEAFDPIEVMWKGEATLREPWVHRKSSIRVRRAGVRRAPHGLLRYSQPCWGKIACEFPMHCLSLNC